ncbi:MAG: hypothetical protein K8W52_33930 [Deltaproteobacteria bacterium]|nr:hypothetical protein [Deltaproteobacteria bacterium]
MRGVGLALAMAVAACDNIELHKLPAPTLESLRPDAAMAPPPPPLPSELVRPAPPAIADFLRAHALDEVAWQASIYSLADDTRPGPRFAGMRVRRKLDLSPPIAAELAARLGRDDAFCDGMPGCRGDVFGIRLTRKGAALDLVSDCGVVGVGVHEPYVGVFSEQMYGFLFKVRDLSELESDHPGRRDPHAWKPPDGWRF